MRKEQLITEIKNFSKSIPRPAEKGTCILMSDKFIQRIMNKGHKCASVQFGTLDKEIHSWVEVWAEDMPLTLVDFTADQFGTKFPHLIVGTPEEVFKQFSYEYVSY